MGSIPVRVIKNKDAQRASLFFIIRLVKRSLQSAPCRNGYCKEDRDLPLRRKAKDVRLPVRVIRLVKRSPANAVVHSTTTPRGRCCHFGACSEIRSHTGHKKRAASLAARPAKKPTVGFFDGARFVVLTAFAVKITTFCRKTKPSGLRIKCEFAFDSALFTDPSR